MNIDILDEKLIKACEHAKLDEIQSLVISGANPNLLDEYGESIFEDVFISAFERIEDEYENATKEEYSEIFNQVKDTVNTLIQYGWEVQKYGLKVMHQFVYMSNQKLAYDIIKFFLSLDLGDDQSEYESLLDTIGTEESFQRCCKNNHDLENVFYAIYESVDARMKNLSYQSIDLYYDAVGMQIDKILYFEKDDIIATESGFSYYNDDIGLLCGDKLLIIRECVNILFINDMINEEHIEVPNLFGDGVIGSKIIDISFGHKEIVKGKSHYVQPTIILSLDNGKKLNFTHNFGENPDDEVQSRFFVSE